MRGTNHRISDRFFDRHTLSGNSRFIKRCASINYSTIHGQGLSRPDNDCITDHNIFYRNFNFRAIP